MTLTEPMTIEQFDKADLPENYELHNGEPVETSQPEVNHRFRQNRILHLLEKAFPGANVVIEYTFVVESTNDKRSADVGMTTRERAREAKARGALVGSPELVVEVMSPSNTHPRLRAYRRLCFESGTLAFWTVASDDQTVEVQIKGENTIRIWSLGEEIPVELWGETKRIPVSAIFEDDFDKD